MSKFEMVFSLSWMCYIMYRLYAAEAKSIWHWRLNSMWNWSHFWMVCVRFIQIPSENTLANGNIFSFAKFRFMSCVGTTATWWWETLKRNDDTCSLHLINITRTACDYSVQMPEWTFCIFYHIPLCSNSVVNTADYPHFSLSLSLTLPHPHIRSS